MTRQNSIIQMIGGGWVNEEMIENQKSSLNLAQKTHRHSITTSSVPDTALHMIASK